MPVSAAQKQKTRARIVDAAADWFRDKGFRGATIDDIMGAADLTRGTFYAHFASKDELFAEVMATRHDLLRRLRERPEASADVVAAEGLRILRDYVDIAHHDKIAPNCTLSTLAADVARTNPETQAAFAQLLDAFAVEIARDQRGTKVPAYALLSMLVGGVLLASSSGEGATQRSILAQCQQSIDRLLEVG